VRVGKEELLAPVRGRRLAEIRRGRGFTQQDVADRMGVTKGRVSQIEQARSRETMCLRVTLPPWAVDCANLFTSTTAILLQSPDPGHVIG
jgi:transcriptional regulator with XRE-family HTH domain